MNNLHESNNNPEQAQYLLGLETRFRIKRDYPKIKRIGAYFGKKLNRTPGAIHQALRGNIPILLNRIIRKLDYMDRVKSKKQERAQD